MPAKDTESLSQAKKCKGGLWWTYNDCKLLYIYWRYEQELGDFIEKVNYKIIKFLAKVFRGMKQGDLIDKGKFEYFAKTRQFVDTWMYYK